MRFSAGMRVWCMARSERARATGGPEGRAEERADSGGIATADIRRRAWAAFGRR